MPNHSSRSLLVVRGSLHAVPEDEEDVRGPEVRHRARPPPRYARPRARVFFGLG